MRPRLRDEQQRDNTHRSEKTPYSHGETPLSEKP
jgi:hypothetical protein